MFTLEQLKAAHAKVQSGADFPAYINEIKQLGVRSYDTYVTDGHTDFYGVDDYKVSTSAKYETLTIAETSNIEEFKKDLKAHQLGQTNYPTFCRDCAKSGVEKWEVCMDKMTCTYYDLEGKELLSEVIPS
jgi:uncharacterized protein YbcV (DUF1398 family)